MKVTAETITDEQIRELRDGSPGEFDITATKALRDLCGVALARPEPTATGRGNQDISAWRRARARCAEILNARKE